MSLVIMIIYMFFCLISQECSEEEQLNLFLYQQFFQAIKGKKRKNARAQKAIGDYCILAGSPADANGHYTTALELCRMTGDYFWYAGALEGGVCAFLVR